MKINDFFEKVVCINPKCNADRWELCLKEADKHGITMERFEGYEGLVDKGMPDPVACVSASHRAVLDAVAYNKWKSCLIFEDDFQFRFDNSQEIFSAISGEVPSDWQMLFLGGSHQSAPLRRASKHIIQTAGIHYVHAYGVTYDFARFAAPRMSGRAAPDSMYCVWQNDIKLQLKSYILQPRICDQRPCVSGCTGKFEDYTNQLRDARLESSL